MRKTTRKPRQVTPRLAQPPRKELVYPARKGREAVWEDLPLKKAKTAKYCKWCKAADGPYQTHNTSECCWFDKEDKEVGKPHKLFDPAKKPRKKGSGDSGQMAYLTKKLEKLEKKLKKSKSKKTSKKGARDSSSNSSDSN